jgi:hypothetical protein
MISVVAIDGFLAQQPLRRVPATMRVAAWSPSPDSNRGFYEEACFF